MSYTYKHPHPSVTVDCIVFALDQVEKDLRILLIRRGVEPFKGAWALPGGFVLPNESLIEAAERELKEESGLENIFLEQLYTFGAPERDPRERVISVTYYALVNIADKELNASSDAEDAGWFSLSDLPDLAFDHELMVKCAIERIKGKIEYKPIGFELLPKKFTLRQLQTVYEIILNKELDKRNFRKKILKMDILDELDEIEKDVTHRAARLYSFNKTKYEQRENSGNYFSL